MKGDAVIGAEGPAAPPRKNGELVFAAPWERDVFGVTIALFERGLFEWAEFQTRLSRALAEAEAAGGHVHYYACWMGALQELLLERGLVDPAELERVTRERERAHAHVG